MYARVCNTYVQVYLGTQAASTSTHLHEHVTKLRAGLAAAALNFRQFVCCICRQKKLTKKQFPLQDLVILHACT